MFVLSRDVSAAKKVIATLLATAIVLWASGAWNTAQAANITDVRNLITDSAPGASADHQIEFSMSDTGLVSNNGGVIDIVFPDVTSDFDLSALVAADVEIQVATVNVDTAWDVTFPDAFTIRLTGNNTGADITASQSVVVFIGTNAVGGTNQIVNPSAPVGGNESFEIDISAGTDSGHTRVVILDTVLVTASVNTIFDFTVYDNGAGETVNGATTNATSSTTTIPFGTLVANTPVIISQDLTVETNAINGFVVTVQSDGALRSSTGADIDEFKDDALVTTPEAWEAPSVGLDITDENTWGHWGITTEDATTTRANEFGVNQWAGVTTTPIVVFSHDGPATVASSVESGQGSTTVGYQVEISALQEAADDYSTTLTYIATPTF